MNGKVYYGTADELVVLGLLGGATTPPPTATPTFSPVAGTYTVTQPVTLTDSTSGATIYYTTNGATPTTASTLYTGAVAVSASETIKAIAVASGLTNSAVGSAKYTIQQATTGTPTFSPAAGTYTATQPVTISDPTSGATIYYTTNGATPTTASTLYAGPVSVSATETLKAIAVASGQALSAVATAAYTINPTSGGGGGSGTTPVSYPSGFSSATGFTLDGGATVTGGALQVTDGGTYENRTIWYSTPLNIQTFTTDFTFQITPTGSNVGDGMTFAIQNQGLTARGGIGGALAYQTVTPSVAVKFDLYSNSGEGVDSVGFYTNGASPTVPSIDLTASGVNLHSGDVMHAHLTYDGTTLTLTLTDTVTSATFTTSQALNIPAIVLANTAFVGFTGGTGGSVATQNILSWTYTSGGSITPPPATTATPTFSPVAGTYTVTQPVTLTDSTSGATIYYTTNGATPTTASTLYTGPVAVSASETIEAIAVASGLTNSAVGSAKYTIQQATTGTPTFSPAAGTYTATQPVTISDPTSDATIYYTTNGATPTTASTLYAGPVSVSATETLKAIAVASGQALSAVATAAYTINPTSGGGGGSGTTPVSYPSGFSSATGFTLDGGATVTGGALQVTDGGTYENRTIWYSTPLNIQTFTTDFTFQITPTGSNVGDGMTFAIQNQGLTARGGIGGALAYQTVTPSVAVKFDLYSNSGEGVDSVGFYTNGASPTVPSIDLTASGVNLHSGDVMHAHLTYDGTTLTLTLTDTVTSATFTTSQALNIPAIVLANTAFVGFTGGTGGSVATQNILSWTYTSGGSITPPPATTATPTFSPVAGTYTVTQPVTLTDSTSGATIYYTTNGATPTTASTLYTGPVAVSASETIEAIAVASGLTNSAVGSAKYTIQQATTGTPTFSPAAGTYTATQPVTISDPTSGATIYYTTNGATPTTASTLYAGPVSVSATETLKAIAVASGQALSAVATAAYTINPTSGGGGGSGTTPVSYPSGFSSATGFTLDGGATVTGGALQVTDGGTYENRTIWYSTPLNIQTFTTDFTFQITPTGSNVGDGMTFAIQNQGLTARGGIGGALAYQTVTPSVAVKFDLYSNSGEGVDSVGFYTNGASPTVPSIDLTASGVNLHSGDVMHAHLTYDGTTLTLTLTDTVTSATFTTSQALNIPAIVLANTAFVGFTGGTGGSVATQNILSWTYQVN